MVWNTLMPIKSVLTTSAVNVCYKIIIWSNINWRGVQSKNVVTYVDMSCLRAPWQNGLNIETKY